MRFKLPDSPEEYGPLLAALGELPPGQKEAAWRYYAKSDLYFLLRFVLKREDLWNPPEPLDAQGEPLELDNEIAPPPEPSPRRFYFETVEGTPPPILGEGPGVRARGPGYAPPGDGRTARWRSFCFSRCREVKEKPDGRLDLWARGHYKSTIITFGLTIQEILRNPEIRVAIFSQNNKTARAHLSQIKREFESNELLKSLFPEILWKKPRGESPLWSRESGIVVKRSGNPKEPTLSSYGLVDGLPVGPHFDLLVYDDTVTKESVRSPGQIRRTTQAWEHSLGLRAARSRVRYIGTRYHLSDTYDEIMKREAATPRVYPALVEGEPVLLSSGELLEIRKSMGGATFACQMMQDPRADTSQGFKREWLEKCRYNTPPEELKKDLRVFIVCDPAASKGREADFTAMIAVGLGADKNYRVLDMVRDHLSLRERWDALRALHRKWAPVVAVGYEDYGFQTDHQYFGERMQLDGYNFSLKPLRGRLSKEDRIRRLSPFFEQGRILLPKAIWKINSEGEPRDVLRDFIEEEYCAFPVGAHDDALDALSRILDEPLGAIFPPTEDERRKIAAARERQRARLPRWVSGAERGR